MAPPAPGLLSTTSVVPSFSPIFCESVRAKRSVAPPAGNGTISADRLGRIGLRLRRQRRDEGSQHGRGGEGSAFHGFIFRYGVFRSLEKRKRHPKVPLSVEEGPQSTSTKASSRLDFTAGSSTITSSKAAAQSRPSRDRTRDEHAPVAARQQQRAAQVLFHHRPQDEAQQQRRRLAAQLEEQVADEAEDRDHPDVEGVVVRSSTRRWRRTARSPGTGTCRAPSAA